MEIVKKGWLEVKRKSKFGTTYKQKFVILRNNSTLRCKTVEILDSSESLEEGRDIVQLWDDWSVQDRPSKSKGRHTFELVTDNEALLIFSCSSLAERHQWMDAFHHLNEMSVQSDRTAATTDYFGVTLLKNRSAIDIGHAGQYLLSIRDSAVILHWKTGAIAHHWPQKSIVKLRTKSGKDDHLLLTANRGDGSGPPMGFEFTTDPASAEHILKLWTICRLDSCGPDKLREISSALDPVAAGGERGGGKARRTPKKSPTVREKGSKEKQDSRALFRNHTLGRERANPPLVTSAGPPRDHVYHTGHSLSQHYGEDYGGGSGAGGLSQDSFFFPRGTYSSSPPPLPPRPPESSSDEDDPDYARIDEGSGGEESGGGGDGSEEARSGSPSLDQQLKEIEQSIKKEKKAKRRAVAGRRRGPPPPLRGAEPPGGPHNPLHLPDADDYLVPVPSKRLQGNRNQSNNSVDYEVPVPSSRAPSESDTPPHVSRSLSQPTYLSSNTGLWQRSPTTPGKDRERSPSAGVTATLPTGLWQRSPTTPGKDRERSPSVGAPSLPPRSWGPPNEDGTAGWGVAGGGVDDRRSPRSSLFTVGEDTYLEGGGAADATPPESASPEESTAQRRGAEEVHQLSRDEQPPADGATPPPLPPRSPIKEKLSWHSSASSVSSACSRCPRCRSRRQRNSVSKTSSLNDHHSHPLSPHRRPAPQGSLPNLSNAAPVPEDGLHSGHRRRHDCHCSQELSSDHLPHTPPHTHTSTSSLPSVSSEGNTSPPYLRLFNGAPSPGVARPKDEGMDMLSSCIQELERGGQSHFGTLPSPRLLHRTPEESAGPRSGGHPPCRRTSRGTIERFDTVPAFPSPSFSSSSSPRILGKSSTIGNHHRAAGAPPSPLSPAGPPVPPRSDVSLEPLPRAQVARSRSLGRQSRHGGGARPQYEASGSSTVFFHHLGRRPSQPLGRHAPQATRI